MARPTSPSTQLIGPVRAKLRKETTQAAPMATMEATKPAAPIFSASPAWMMMAEMAPGPIIRGWRRARQTLKAALGVAAHVLQVAGGVLVGEGGDKVLAGHVEAEQQQQHAAGDAEGGQGDAEELQQAEARVEEQQEQEGEGADRAETETRWRRVRPAVAAAKIGMLPIGVQQRRTGSRTG